MRSAARTVPEPDLMRDDISLQAARQRPVVEQLVDRVRQLLVAEVVGRQPSPEPGLVDPLGVVDLVPEQRQHDHRLAVVERLGDGVVAAVGDHEVHLREDRRLRQEPLPRLVVVERDLVGERALRDDDPVLGGGQQVDQALHQPDVRGPERAQRQVDQRPVALPEVVRQLPGRVGGADRRVHAVPRRAERALARVVGLGRVAVEVEPRRFGGEVGAERAVRQPGLAVVAAERVEVGPHVAVRPADLLEEGRPVAPVRRRIAGRERRDGRVLDLGRVAGHDADPRPPGRAERGERRRRCPRR